MNREKKHLQPAEPTNNNMAMILPPVAVPCHIQGRIRKKLHVDQTLLDDTKFGLTLKLRVRECTEEVEMEVDEDEGEPKSRWKPTSCYASRVRAGSSAEMFGFQVDDHLLSVGGKPIMTKRRCRAYRIPSQASEGEDEDQKTHAWKSHVQNILDKCRTQVKEAVSNGEGTFIIERMDPDPNMTIIDDDSD